MTTTQSRRLGGSALISETKRLTNITDHALARKLAVSVDEVRACQENKRQLSPEALEVLRAFHRSTVTARTQLSAPRTKAPAVEEGVLLGDSGEVLRKLPDCSVDAIVSDIPYGIGLEDWDVLHSNTNSALLGSSDAQKRAGRVFDKRRKPINGWSSADREIPEQYYRWCCEWASEWLRVLKPGASAMVFAGRRLAPRCVQAMEDSGFNFRDMLAWLKPRAVFRAQRLSTVLQKRGELAEADRWEGWRVGNLAPTFEPIIWCFKPYDVTIADNVLDHMVGAMNAQAYKNRTGTFDNVIRAGLEPGEGGHHEAQKPIAIMQTLIELCVPPDGLVLDPFAGSGSTGVAAVTSGRRYLMVEKDETHWNTARERIRKAASGSAQPRLPFAVGGQ